MTAALSGGRRPPTSARWLASPWRDAALALLWVPFAAVAAAAGSRQGGAGDVLRAAFLVSFLHQPVTIALVYGDPATRRSRPTVYALSPIVFVLAVWLGLATSPWLVALVAGGWNAVHTLLQRYGIVRLYGARAGQRAGGAERALLLSGLAVVALWAAADPATPARVDALPLGGRNAAALEHLTALRPVAAVLLAGAAVCVLVLARRWFREEGERLRRGEANPAKWLYLGSTFALFAWMLVDPVGGFIAYVGSHALEYLVVVHRSLEPRYSRGPGALGALLRRRRGRAAAVGLYAAAMLALLVTLRTAGTPRAYQATVLVLGGLHVFYDGLIWKLRQPAVAEALAPTAAGIDAA